MTIRQRIAALVLAASAVAAPLAFSPPAQAAPCTIAAAGDVAGASDYRTNAEATGNQIAADTSVQKVIALGDLAYSDGTVTEFNTYYHPAWGPIKSRTLAVAGNHERGGTGFRSYFGDAAWTNRVVSVCGWNLVLVNQYLGADKGAAFIRNNDRPGPEIIAWHAPRYSSGSEHGNDPTVDALWRAAVDTGANIVLNGHDHDYERFAKVKGTREFVSGLGGHAIRGFGTIRAGSAKRYTGKPGVLYLDLNTDRSYTWRFKTVDGTIRDTGFSPVP